MPTSSLAGQTIYYAARGMSGAPLVFVHGAGDSHLAWNCQLATFAGTVRTIALDLPGHGRSGGAGRSTIYEYAAVVAEFIQALQREPVILVGISMGGAIAQTVALEFPQRVCALGLIGTGAKLRVAPAFLQGLTTDFEQTARLLVSNLYAEGAPPALLEKSLVQLRSTGAPVAWGDYIACDTFDVRERLTAIRVPTLVVCGREDRMTPVKYSEFLAQRIPQAELSVIEQAGHMVMLEQPAAFNAALGDWLGTQRFTEK